LDFNEQQSDHFAPVRVNETLTLLFDEDTSFDSHHYALHVSDAEFDAIFERLNKAGLSYGSAPWSLNDGKLNDWNGGRGVYFKDPNGHVLELMDYAAMKLLRPSRPWCARNGPNAPRFEPFIDFLVKRGQHVKQGRNAL